LWNFNKKAERQAKTKLLNKNGDQLSAVEPMLYQNRFNSIINQRVLTLAESEYQAKG
jgi:hypothetical protein